nr:hypothetical protein [Gloeocapsa sp. PCC 7428]
MLNTIKLPIEKIAANNAIAGKLSSLPYLVRFCVMTFAPIVTLM